MEMNEFRSVCFKLGMKEFCNYNDEAFFWETLSSDSFTSYFTFNGYDFCVAKYVNRKAYVWHNDLYKVIDQQTPEHLEEQINLFHKNYKEYLIQNKIKDINKDFKEEIPYKTKEIEKDYKADVDDFFSRLSNC